MNRVPLMKGLDFTQPDVTEGLRSNRVLLLSIFTSSACNLRCPYCFTAGWSKKRGALSIDDYKQLLADGQELGAKSLWWVGQGEPLLVSYWRDLINASENLKLWTGIFTNGTLLDDDASQFCLEHNVSLYMKINSFSAEVQGKLIGSDGKEFLDTVLPRIEWFVEKGVANQRRLAIESVITKLNYYEIPSLFRWCPRSSNHSIHRDDGTC